MDIGQTPHSPTPLSVEEKSTRRSAKILVVDDDETMRTLLSLLFSRAGVDVTQASNGFEGLQLLSREYFDLVVTDVAMPVKDGLTMISEARDVAPGVRFVVHSGSDCETLERAKSLSQGNILTVLSKAMPPSEKIAAVHDALRACGRECQEGVGQATQAGDAYADANPLFGAVRNHFGRRGTQAAHLEGRQIEPPPSRHSRWRLHPPWSPARI